MIDNSYLGCLYLTFFGMSGDIWTPMIYKYPTNTSHFYISISPHHITSPILSITYLSQGLYTTTPFGSPGIIFLVGIYL